MSDTKTTTKPVATAPAKPVYKTASELRALPILPAAKEPIMGPGGKRIHCAMHPDARIRILSGNPKKPGTEAHRIWSYYQDGMTVASFLANENIRGGRGKARADIDWNYERGFLTLQNFDGTPLVGTAS